MALELVGGGFPRLVVKHDTMLLYNSPCRTFTQLLSPMLLKVLSGLNKIAYAILGVPYSHYSILEPKARNPMLR